MKRSHTPFGEQKFKKRGAYFSKLKNKDPKKVIEIELGDSKSSDAIYPQFKTKHWNNESNFSVRLSDSDYAGGAVKTLPAGMQWERAGRTARLYDLVTDDEGGGFEFEVELATKPANNTLEFTVQHKGLSFFKQKGLDEEINPDPGYFVTPTEHYSILEDGTKDIKAQRPENVVGSYAVYHSEKADNHDDVHYETGKAFHIYRPFVVDSGGRKEWCELNIDEKKGMLTVTLPEDFWETAEYPILVDPTIGYTTQGASDQGICSAGGDNAVVWKFTAAAATTFSAIASYLKSPTGTVDQYRHLILNDNSGVPNYASQAYAASFANITASYSLHNQTGLSTGVSLGTTVWVGVEGSESTGSGASFLAYDTGGVAGSTAFRTDIGTWDQTSSQKLSTYGTYTEAGSRLSTEMVSFSYAPASTPVSITKSLQYAILTTPSALTKSLQYAIKSGLALTKALTYTIPSTPPALTKSLQYAILKTPSALTKSLQYAVTTTASAITKSLQYAVRPAVAITKSLQYAVTSTTAAVTKSLKYTVVKAASALTKSLQYAVKAPSTAITKSLKYTVPSTVSAITKSLQYAVKTTVTLGGAGFSPADISGLRVWLDANQIPGLADGDPVTTWPDLSAYGTDATNGSQGAPVFKTNIVNGFPVVRFTSSVSAMRAYYTQVGGAGAPWTMFVVAKQRGGANERVVGSVYPAYSNWLLGWHSAIGEGGAYYNGAFVGPGGTVTNTFRQFTGKGDGSIGYFYAEGSLLASSGSASQNPNGAIALSGYDATGYNETSNADIAEVILYDGALSDADREAVEDYLNEKYWGSGLPSGGKSLTYNILPIATYSITKGLQYSVKYVPTAITKSLAYYVRKSIALTSSLQYVVKSAVALTKSLKYTLRTTPTSLTESLQYAIKTVPVAATKSLQYAIGAATAVTKSLTYDIKSGVSITKSLKYAVYAGAFAITKNQEYVIDTGKRYWVGGTDSWNGTAGTKWAYYSGGPGGASNPVGSNMVILDANSGTGTVTIQTQPAIIGGLDASAFQGTLIESTNINIQSSVYGDFILGSGMAFTYTAGTIKLQSSKVADTIVDLAGHTVGIMTFNGTGATFVLHSDVVCSNSSAFTLGTVDFNGYNFTCLNLANSAVNTRTVNMRGGTLTLTGTGAVFDAPPTAMTWSWTSGAKILLSDTSATAKTFAGGTNTTLPRIEVAGAASAGLVTFSGAFTADSIKLNPDANVKFTSGVTTTLTNGIVWDGTSGHLITIAATTPGSAATISSSAQQVAHYINLKDNTASGGTPFKAYNSTDSGGNTNWSFVVPTALTKSLQYEVVTITTTAIQKGLVYTVKAAASLTKNLTYDVKTTAAALTKSLTYGINTVPSALTKSLQYAVRPAISITQQLIYTVKSPVAITKSLKYTVVKAASAITKSLTYDVRTTSAAITKSLSYYVRAATALTKSLTYDVKSPVAVTKSLKYTVTIAQTAITKSLGYIVGTQVTIQKSLSYAIKTIPSALTKNLTYDVKSAVAVTKQLIYDVKTTPSALTKSLQYAIKTVPSALTKSLKYVVRLAPITKSLVYDIKTSTAVTKSLTYTVRTLTALTKSLKYTVKIVPSALTKSLRYAIVTTSTATRNWLPTDAGTQPTAWLDGDSATGLSDGDPVTTWTDLMGGHDATGSGSARPLFKTGILNGHPVIRFDGADDRMHFTNIATALSALNTYTIFFMIKPTTFANYPIIMTYPTSGAWSWILEFNATTGDFFWGHNNGSYRLYQPGTALNWNMFSLSRSSATAGKFYRDGTEITSYSSAGSGFSAAPVMSGDMILGNYYDGNDGFGFAGDIAEIIVVTTTLSDSDRQKMEGYLAWKYGRQTTLPVGHPYYSAAPTVPGDTKSLTYAIRAAADITKSLTYDVKSAVSLTKSLIYDIKTVPAAVTKSLRYAIRVVPAITKALSYAVKPTISLTKTLKYTVRIPLSLTKGLVYDVRTTPAALTKALTYEIRTVVSLTKSLAYRVRLAPITKSLTYEIKTVLSITKGLIYDVKTVPAAMTKSLKYEIRTILALSKNLKYAVRITPAALTAALKYEIKTFTSITKSLTYDIRTTASMSKSLRYAIRVVPAITKSLRYAVKASPALTKGMQYIIAVPVSISKTLSYYVRKQGALTKSLDYNIRDTFSISKQLRYVVKTSGAITKSMRYTIVEAHILSAVLRYVMRVNPYCPKPTPYSEGDSPYEEKLSPLSPMYGIYSARTSPYEELVKKNCS